MPKLDLDDYFWADKCLDCEYAYAEEIYGELMCDEEDTEKCPFWRQENEF